MQHILLLGAGQSATSLIQYLLGHSAENDWHLTIGEQNVELARQKSGGHPRARLITFDIKDANQVHQEIERADLVISMLPAMFHGIAAKKCVELGKDMLTASNVSRF